MATGIALYIHIPFCLKRCSYCSFVSFANRSEDIESYIEAVIREINQRVNNRRIKSVYIGGGTPTLLSVTHIECLLKSFGMRYSGFDNIEISLEANPGTVDEGYLKALKNTGVNRLSIGVQSLNDIELHTLGRSHYASDGIKAVECARNAGFDNINVDLIYGIPGQDLSSWKRTLEDIICLTPEHLSLYALSLEPGTDLQKQVESGVLSLPDLDLSADQYELAEDLLARQGYRHYEISNWAKPGYECRHNLTYWNHEEYIGVGVGACSYQDGHRFNNSDSLDRYLTSVLDQGMTAIESDEVISPELAASEAAILSLRLDVGINIERYNRDYNTDILSMYNRQIEELKGYGLLEYDEVDIKLTKKGRLLGNEVFWRFLPEDNKQVGGC
jgi:oxygen-independent coproporphyrinogen-3 oxidase